MKEKSNRRNLYKLEDFTMGKKKRLQPRPKKKKVVFVSKQDKLNLMKKDLTLKLSMY